MLNVTTGTCIHMKPVRFIFEKNQVTVIQQMTGDNITAALK